MFFVKKDFTFGFRTVKSGEIHLIQTTHVPMLIYEFPSSSLRCRANPNLFRRSFEPFDQMLYHRMKKETLRSKGLQATASDPGSCTCRDKQRPSEQQPGPFSKKKRVFITPVIRPSVAPVLIARPFTALSAPQPDDTIADDTIDPSTRSTFADNISDSFTRSTTRVDNISYSSTRSTCGRDFGADPYG
ncbi:hypothetical protein TNCV_2431271 [Trichonephila clavipes]|nr:hypothetical protein TNCV_2431271 [Trichonephila clavipes]